MTTRPRARWFALFAGALLIALSATSALGAGPSGDEEKNHGQQVSEFVHSLLFGDPTSEDEDAPADEDATSDEDTEDEEEAADEDSADEDSESGQPDNHGACVRDVAMDADEVGGENENHGGAVSEAARVTCWEDESGGEEASEESDEAAVHGKSADAHNKPHGHGHGHGGS